MATGLTKEGYWALLANAGIARIARMPGGTNWSASNRAGEHFPVRDPDDLTPLERQEAADYVISYYGG